MANKLTTGARIEHLLKLRPRLTSTQIAEAICLPYAETQEELEYLYTAARIEQFKTSLGMLVWQLIKQTRADGSSMDGEDDQGSGKSGAGTLTLDMSEQILDEMAAPSSQELKDAMDGFYAAILQKKIEHANQAKQARIATFSERAPDADAPKILGKWRRDRQAASANETTSPAPGVVSLAYEEWKAAIDDARESWKSKHNKKGGMK